MQPAGNREDGMAGPQEPFSERVKLVRKFHGETQEQFAKRLGVHEVTIQRWENLFGEPFSREVLKFLEVESTVLASGARGAKHE
jgi:transcriptional regulator with XRE-family HTH domain